MPAIFISYRRDDSAFESTVLHDTLQRSFGKRNVFMDVDGIPIGVDFGTHIVKTLRRSDICLAVISQSWLTAVSDAGQRRLDDPHDFVRQELEISQASGLHVVPVLIGKAELPVVDVLPVSLQFLPSLQAIRVRPGGDLNQDLKTLIERLREIGSLRAAANDSQPRHLLGQLATQISRCAWHPLLDALVFGGLFSLYDLLTGSKILWHSALEGFAEQTGPFRFAFMVLAMFGMATALIGAAVVHWAVHDLLYCGTLRLFRSFIFWRFAPELLFVGASILAGVASILGGQLLNLFVIYFVLWLGFLLSQRFLDRERTQFVNTAPPFLVVAKQKAISSVIASLWFTLWLVGDAWYHGNLAQSLDHGGLLTKAMSIAFFVGLLGSIYCTAAQIVRGTLRWREI